MKSWIYLRNGVKTFPTNSLTSALTGATYNVRTEMLLASPPPQLRPNIFIIFPSISSVARLLTAEKTNGSKLYWVLLDSEQYKTGWSIWHFLAFACWILWQWLFVVVSHIYLSVLRQTLCSTLFLLRVYWCGKMRIEWEHCKNAISLAVNHYSIRAHTNTLHTITLRFCVFECLHGNHITWLRSYKTNVFWSRCWQENETNFSEIWIWIFDRYIRWLQYVFLKFNIHWPLTISNFQNKS